MPPYTRLTGEFVPSEDGVSTLVTDRHGELDLVDPGPERGSGKRTVFVRPRPVALVQRVTAPTGLTPTEGGVTGIVWSGGTLSATEDRFFVTTRIDRLRLAIPLPEPYDPDRWHWVRARYGDDATYRVETGLSVVSVFAAGAAPFGDGPVDELDVSVSLEDRGLEELRDGAYDAHHSVFLPFELRYRGIRLGWLNDFMRTQVTDLFTLAKAVARRETATGSYHEQGSGEVGIERYRDDDVLIDFSRCDPEVPDEGVWVQCRELYGGLVEGLERMGRLVSGVNADTAAALGFEEKLAELSSEWDGEGSPSA